MVIVKVLVLWLRFVELIQRLNLGNNVIAFSAKSRLVKGVRYLYDTHCNSTITT